MLESVALRILGCDEFSRPKTITFALDTLTLMVHADPSQSTPSLTHPTTTTNTRPKKALEEDLKHVIPLRRALMSIPTLKHCKIRSHAKPQDVPAMYFPLNEDTTRPHYQVGQHVWCVHGGWGYWPATVFAIEETCLEILLCWGDMTQVTYSEAPTHVFPFMQNLAKYSVMSTNLQEGFHEGVEKVLAEVVRFLPSHCIEDFALRPRERFAARMLRIAGVFEAYTNSLMKIPIFHNLQKEISRRHVKIAKEIEDEERKIVAEQRRLEKEEREAEREQLREQREFEYKAKCEQRAEEKAKRQEEKARIEEEKLQLKVYNAIHFPPGSTIFAVPDKMKATSAKKATIPLKVMLRNLEEESHSAPDRKKRKRSVVKCYKEFKIHDQNGEVSQRSSLAKKNNTDSGVVDGDKGRNGIENKDDDMTLLEFVQVFHMEYTMQQERKVDRGVQIYSGVYDSLMSGTYTDDESLEYSIKNLLPIKFIKMLLYKYFPFDIYKGKNGRTLIHLAAQYDYSTVIPLLHTNWEKRLDVIHDHGFHNTTNFAMIKDGHGRTAVHVACEFGSFKSLKVLKNLGCDLYERDKLGYTPLMWCASKDTPQCAFYLIENGADVTEEDRKGRSTLWHSMAGDSVFLGKTLFRNGCWMQGNGLQEFVADMSLGREPHKITFDARSLAECKAVYLNPGNEIQDACSRNLTISSRTRHLKESSPRSSCTSPSLSSNSAEYDDDDDDGDDNVEDSESSECSPRLHRSRVSSRVVKMSKEVADEELAVESSKWSLSKYMANVCVKSPELIPKFVYCTQSYLGELADKNVSTSSKSSAYECCDCEGDCTLNPDCACIMRNGQRSPYSREGLFDFTKGKIFECGDKCSCKDSCKLRMTQRGVAYPLVVCRTGTKGHGVMTTKVIVKGSYVCAYVGERVSEDDLIEQEEEKLRNLKKKGNFVTYAFEIHEGTETFNVDSEYVGNVARFFNHSCDPNLRPVKVVAASKQKFPTMCFFALRRIEAGEELTWKYVTGMSTKKGGQACYCKAANCTGFV